jgi:hypothetical protein
MPTTPIYALPYPAATDPADVPADMQRLANRLEAVLPTLGGVVKISDQLLAAPGAFAFPGIPNTYSRLVLSVFGRGDTAAQSVTDVYVRFNSDAGANYDDQQLVGQATSVAGTEEFGQAQGKVGRVPAATAPASVFSSLEASIEGYAGSQQKTYNSRGGWKGGTVTSNLVAYVYTGFWRSTAAITRIDVGVFNGSFIAGSRAVLYGYL